MTTCDVVIIGGGPAGSSCARRLTQGGATVLVLDRRDFPRDKTCAGWVTPPVLQVLDVDRDEFARGRTLQPITGFRTGLIDGPTVDTRYDRPVSYGIRRCEFDDYLLRRSGAQLSLGTDLKSLERIGDRWRINDAIETPLVVGAGGHFCPVARRLGARENAAATVVTAQEIEYPPAPADLAACHVDPETPELYFCPDLKGYGWCFRKGDHLNIGLGRTETGGLAERIAEFVSFLRRRGTLAGELPQRFHGHAYQLYERVVPRFVDDGVVLIGDAAGLAYPQSGEGIRPAVESGLLAADVILAANGNHSATALEPYAQRIAARFGPPRSGSSVGWLPAGWMQGLAARLLRSPAFARHVVVDRWFLHTQQPTLELQSVS